MAISGTMTFNLDIGDLMEEAYERAGLRLETGYDLRTGKRTIDLVLLEWQNRDIDIWMVEEKIWDEGVTKDYCPVDDQIDLSLAIGTVDVLDVILRTGDTQDGEGQYLTVWSDSRLTRLTERAYSAKSDKNTAGVPHSYYMKTHEIQDMSGSTQAVISLYPSVNDGTDALYNVLYWRTKRIADVGDPSSNTVEVPAQYLPALVAGMAFQIGMKHGEVGGRLPVLKTDYDEQIALLGKAASPNDESQMLQPAQAVPAQQQYPMVRSRDGSMRISRTSGARRM